MTIYDAIERIPIFEKTSHKMKSKIISYDVGVKSRLFNGFWHAYSYFCSLTTE